jgi:hypothetical protein
MTESTWRLVDKDLPDWSDGGEAELRQKDGSTVKGYMLIEEQWTGAEEIPYAVFTADSGEQLSIFDYEAWRIIKRGF